MLANIYLHYALDIWFEEGCGSFVTTVGSGETTA
jgi:hypothetical protein